MKKPTLDANLIKKYHQDIVFNYAEYPTCDHWDFSFNDEDYKKALIEWIPQNPDKKIFFYVHIPFCEQLCWFCTCSKIITKDYNKVKEYLVYLYKEIDILFNYLNENNIKLNVGTVFFGGGSPTILNREDLKELVDKLKQLFDWSNVENFTVESDPRRVDEDRLIYNAEICGANRISFGMQDFDENVQRKVNRIQPASLFENILTKKVRKLYSEIAFDFLIGLPGQNTNTISSTCDKIIQLQPTLVQLSLLAYKPWVAKYQIKMLAEGPLPDFLERKELLEVIHQKLSKAGYIRTGFECYSLPNSPMTKAYNDGTAHYGASGHQTGGKVNFIGVGSSSKSNLGDDYYAQNVYDVSKYKKFLDNKKLPIFRGMKLSKDDQIRQHATQQFKSYLKMDFKPLEDNFKIDPKEYFAEEINELDEMIKDGLVQINEFGIFLTEIGKDFSQNISNVFDKYDPPSKSYADRLKTIQEAKASQSKVLGEI
ncbi:MAG: oxygen-independent coproporphyrinogen III oxidase [Candidatus Pelagibacter sp. TMED273]|nr:MAG: oxygen-independent coproporphyrinogen III oxidase [Candidatus Pelagibacter sp. TMED273]|tara:strand:- start:3456 stop:4901 length:1446 start_codon:yes stop_codon:yes gene_type:complete